MSTVAQAARVAGLTGGTQMPGSLKGRMSRRVDLGDDFEAHRPATESVSVLFKLFDLTDGVLAEVPSGWTITGASFEVEWPFDRMVVKSHFGARRFAYNWARGQVGADLDAHRSDPEHDSVGWSLAELRKEWNRVKVEVAPWWPANSKEAYASGIADLATGLKNWSKSDKGERKGRNVGFPRFKSKRTDANRVRFTTGPMRFAEDRRTIVLPVIGPLRSKENTRRLQRPLAQGRAKLLNMTLTERWGRLFVSVNYALRTPPTRPVSKPGVRAGVDLGLASLATVADSEGNITEFANPAPLRQTIARRRRAGRQMSRRIPGSRGFAAAKTKLARMDRRAVHLRREAHHQLTTFLAGIYSEIVVEDLDLAAMKMSMGRRAFRRSVSDAALGSFRPLLSYKTDRAGTTLIVADRFFPSSQLHHGCGRRLEAPVKLAKLLVCPGTGELVDRDTNAALNLRDWPDRAVKSTASLGLVEAQAPNVSSPAGSGGDVGSDEGSAPRRRRNRKTVARKSEASSSEATTTADLYRSAKEPRKRGAA